MIQQLANRIYGVPNWPPKGVKDHWSTIEDYRRRLENDWEEMLKNTPYFSGSHERTNVFTPVPIVRELAAFSADLMFSEPANITFDTPKSSASTTSPSEAGEESSGSDSDTLTEALKILRESNGFDPFLQDVGQAVAIEGRGALRVQWDDDLPLAIPVPVIDYVPEDQVIWEIKYRRFVVAGTVVVTRVDDRARNVYRLFERHELGKVTRTLYRGSSGMLGKEVPLTSYEEFSQLAPTLDTGVDALTLIRWDNVPGGKSDISGMDTLLDRINEEFSIGTLKSRRSKPITFADRSLADEQGRIDMDGIQLLDQAMLLPSEEQKLALQTVQPDVQTDAQIAWIDYLLDSGLLFMGYSKASYGRDEGGSADSGKALKLRQARTLLKRAGKERMAREAIQTVISVAMAMLLGTPGVADLKPKVDLGLGLPIDELEVAEFVSTAMTAKAMSKKTAVRTLHPDWTEDEVDEEVEAIEESEEADAVGQMIGRAMPGSAAASPPAGPGASASAQEGDDQSNTRSGSQSPGSAGSATPAGATR